MKELDAADTEFKAVLLAVHASGVLKSKDMEAIVGEKRRATMYRIIGKAADAARAVEAAKAAE